MYSAKVHQTPGGDQLVVEPGGSIKFGGVTMSVNASGILVFTGLPTADPEVVGAPWSDSGTIKVSAGP